MNQTSRKLLDQNVKNFFVRELQKEFKEDFNLVADKIEELIPGNTIKEIRFIARAELLKRKKHTG